MVTREKRKSGILRCPWNEEAEFNRETSGLILRCNKMENCERCHIREDTGLPLFDIEDLEEAIRRGSQRQIPLEFTPPST